nr:PHP domain-containing protein [Limosilactobacillus mucosae]
MNVWTPLHLHTDISNPSYFEVVSQADQYIDWAVKQGQKAICFTEHGNAVNWIKKKIHAEKAGLKFIFGIEAYVTMQLEDDTRYHTILIAKNYQGVQTILRLSSQSFNRQDRHFYRKPRIAFDELKQAFSEGNIYITTACLAGALGANLIDTKDSDEVVQRKSDILSAWLGLAESNPDMFLFEIQPHNNPEQQQLNNACINYASYYGCRIVASNDIHALNPYHDKLRKIVKKGKGASYSNEDEFELWCKTYDEMVDSFVKCGVNEKFAKQALDTTNEIADSIETFELDRSHKYPHLYKRPEQEFQKRIKQGLHERGIDKMPKDEQQKYVDRINYEYKVYKHNSAIDYMLAHEDILNAAKEHGIHFGFGRGSINGSLIAYLCGQTDMDSVKLGLNFERFMNPERVSLADIDVDSYSVDQQWIQKWMLTTDKFHSASILTTNTYGLKGAIKAIADGLPRYAGKPQYIQSIRNQIDADGTIPQALYEEHKELIDMARDIVGVTDSFGRHAAGIVVDTTPIDNTMGTMTIANWDYPVSQIAMKEIEYCAWVKFDMLGLDNVGLINKTAELAGIPYPTPNSDFIDFNDEKVWKSMRENNIGIFQFEGDRAGKILKQVFSDETVSKIKEQVPDYQYIDLLSLANAAQRPSGASYIDAIMNGEFKDNGHEALNKFLAPTLGFMVYQEQQIQFLVQFCGYTAGQADILRRAIGHKQKDVMEQELPKVHQSFVKTMVEKYGDSQEHADRIAEDFMQVFIDSANYGFSVNHSMAYSYIGYIATWLRYYYPLEFCTAAFEVWKDKKDKINKITKFAKERGIQLKPVKFGKSKGLYYMDKDTNTIYEGTATIKGCNAKIGDILYEYGQKTYDSFTDMLIDLYENKIYTLDGDKCSVLDIYHKYSIDDIKEIDKHIKTKANGYSHEQSKEKTSINSKNMLNLISLGYFGQFGSRKKLALLLNKFKSCYHVNNKTLANKCNKYMGLLAFEQGLSDDEYPLLTILKKEHELLGRCISVNHAIDSQLMYVVDFTLLSNKAKVVLYSPKYGKEAVAFATKKTAKNIANDTLVKVTGIAKKPKNVLVDGQWRKSKTDYEHWITNIKLLVH